jgi:hypothetical protein
LNPVKGESKVTIENRSLSTQERIAQQRLQQLWFAKKRPLRLTQEIAAKQAGWSTSAVGHYLSGRLALNTDAVLAFSKILRVAPNEIWPDLIKTQLDAGDVLNPETLERARRIDRLSEEDRRAINRIIDMMAGTLDADCAPPHRATCR